MSGEYRSGLSNTERGIAVIVATVLGGLHWAPSPGFQELSGKLDDSKAQIAVLFEQAKTTNASLADIKTALAVTNEDTTAAQKTIIDHEGRIRALEIELAHANQK